MVNWSRGSNGGNGGEREAAFTSNIEEYLCNAFNLKFVVHLGGRNTSFCA